MKAFPLSIAAALLLAGSVSASPGLQTAEFAGGCFWTMEHGLETIPGVVNAVSGYEGGRMPHPTLRTSPASGPAIWKRFRSPMTPARLAMRSWWIDTGV